MAASRQRALAALADCLNGARPKGVDWDAVIGLANESLTITALAAAVEHASTASEQAPDDVRQYLNVILERNRTRNARLLNALAEAARSLNAAGIVPAVMKGAAILLGQRQGEIGDRLLTDIDLLVPPNDMSEAIDALKRIGYEIMVGGGMGSWPGDPRFHLPTVLYRPGDAGSIDLQCRPKGPHAFSDPQMLFAKSSHVDLDGATLAIPSPLAQIAYLLLHDQFQDGDYFRGLIDVRHLFDITIIVRRVPDVDWRGLRAMFPSGYERNAVDTQLLTAKWLFGVGCEWDPRCSGLARLQLQRRRTQLRWAFLWRALTVMSLLLELPHYPAWDRYGGLPLPSKRKEAVRKLRELRRLFRPRSLGKI